MTELTCLTPPPQSSPLKLFPFFSLPQLSHAQRDIIAGSLAGFCIVLTGHPLDTLKVRMQMLHTGFLKTCTSMIKNEGAMALYKGVRSPLYTTPITTSVSFAAYESASRMLGIKPGEKRTISAAALSGTWAGFVFATVVTPIELLKTRLQMEGVGDSSKGTKLSNLFRNIVKTEGVPALYKGLVAAWIRDAPSFTVQFATFEYTKRIVSQQFGESSMTSFLSGGFAVLVAWIFAYPQDTIKTRIQCSRVPMSIMQSTSEIYKAGGFGGFWKGISPALLRAVVTGATRFIAYDKCQELIGNKRNRI